MSIYLDLQIEELQESVQQNPLDLDLWITLINRVAAEESAENALEEIFIAEDIFPDCNEILALKSLCLMSLGESSEAHELLQTSLRRCPGDEMVDRILKEFLPNFRDLSQDLLFNPFSLRDRLSADQFQKDLLEKIESTIELIHSFNNEENEPEHLIQALERHVRSFPDDVNARLDLARLCHNLEKHKESKRHYEAVIAKDPMCASAFFELATIEPDLDRAIELSENGLDLSPRFECGRFNYAGLLLQSGMLKEGRNEMLRLPADSPYYLPGLEAIAKSYCEEGTFEEALKFQRKVCILSPSNPEAWNSYGHFFASIGDYTTAIKHFDRAITIDNEHIDALHNRALMLAKLDRNEEAVHVLRYALTIEPENESLLVNLGVELSHANRLDEAIEVMSESVLLYPDHARMWLNLGSFYFRKDNFEESLRCSRRAIEIDPEQGLAWWNIATVHAVREDKDQCIDALQLAIQKRPELQELVANEEAFRPFMNDSALNFPLE